MAERGVPSAIALEGPLAMPRRNGELLFAEPWESRVFGMAVALHERGFFSWEDFRARLIGEIARAERSATEFRYYACWQAALEAVLDGRALCKTDEIGRREATLAARPAGHDHGHGSDHSHDPDHPHDPDPGHDPD